MNAANEKAARVLPTPQAAQEIQHAQFTPEQKRLATLIAQFALHGHSVYQIGQDGYLVTRWGMSRHCPDLASLVGFGRQIGATQ